MSDSTEQHRDGTVDSPILAALLLAVVTAVIICAATSATLRRDFA